MEKEDLFAAAADIESTTWSSPPPYPQGKPFTINFRNSLEQLANVDTVNGTCHVKIALMFYWTDTRMIGWEGKLPANLWGPYFDCYQKSPDCEIYSRAFAIVDAAVGRMKRTICIEGIIFNPMDVRDFPFDIDDVCLRFWTASNWKSLDGSDGCGLAKGRDYHLAQIEKKSGEGQWMNIGFGGDVPDWHLTGVSTKITTCGSAANGGQETSDFFFRIHLMRKSSYYMWKAVVPVWVLGALTLKTFVYPVDDLASRDAYIATLILANFAMTYVTASFLPRTDFLTSIDKVTNASLVLQFFIGFCNSILYIGDRMYPDHIETMFWINVGMGVFSTLFLIITSLVFLCPGYNRVSTLLKKLSKVERVTCDGMDYTSASQLGVDSSNSAAANVSLLTKIANMKKKDRVSKKVHAQ